MTQTLQHHRITVLGAGNFGTCLAQLFAQKGFDVVLWDIVPQIAESISTRRRHPTYLKDFMLSDRIVATVDRDERIVTDSDAVVLAVPTQALRSMLTTWKGIITDAPLIICAAKGIETDTLKLPGAVISDVLGETIGRQSVILSGPSFAVEIMGGQPTCVSLASHSKERALFAQKICHTPLFRCYTSDDPIGLETAGALKNVIAIAAGAAAGLGYQQNSQAALMTRGLAEMMRIGLALGANPLTFNGLGGVGDLFLTCTSRKSRNFTVGFRLGQGDKLQDILAAVGSVAEGVSTAEAAYTLAERLQVDAPIIREVYSVLYQGKDIMETIHDLLNRTPKPEIT
jgi:glycerol-3-phosphate dehydrogenase (NAD(P)+)